MRGESRRDSKQPRLALRVALFAIAALGIAGCRSIDPNGCSSTQFTVLFPKAIGQDTTVRLTIDGHVYELVCPQEGAFQPVTTDGYASIYLPVTGGGIGYCTTNSFTIYLDDKPPSEIVNVSLHAQDAHGMPVFDVPVTFLPNVEMPDQDGMPGVCYLQEQS
jgi:hypothetical protein